MNKLKIFVVDDEEILRISLADDLSDVGYEVSDFANPVEALQAAKEVIPDVVVTDLKMPQMDGIQFLQELKKIDENIQVIIMTAFGSIESAVQAMKLGAFDYLTKPFEVDELLVHLNRIEEFTRLNRMNMQYQQHFKEKFPLQSFIGRSEKAKKILELVQIVAKSDSTVLITGETGTGKELLANIIHYNSPRRHKPLIKVSCAILAKDVIESELFGHEKGAFTGATKDKKGRFELAHEGTIYLDDIDDIPLEVQVKLLRVLQEREVERVGGTKPIKIDVRVIASTKYDLAELVKEGKFREDLYYRLNVFPINIPPLRERREDIRDMVYEFLKEFQKTDHPQIDENALKCLEGYDWPGNVRELRNVVERMVLLSQGKTITAEYFPPELQKACRVYSQFSDLGRKSLNDMLAELEIELIKNALKEGGTQAEAAKILQIPPSTLRSKMQKYGISE